ncbi:MAG: peptidase T [Dysgonamonadaceae bacterium]|jgi:tripeptide aminopeptidase|nr:peptidase T [Dysgonamonadaceae bacterium]
MYTIQTAVKKRFLKYVTYNTQSDKVSHTVPSTVGQTIFAKALEAEMREIGMTEISIDNNSVLMATLPSNTDVTMPVIGFIAHLDTSPDFSGENVKPKIVKKYDGSDIILNKRRKIVLSPETFPELLLHVGEDLIVTDGTTLLGADDKAGIAEIMTAIEYLISNPGIKHGAIRVAFTPDEEIGKGIEHFDVKKFGCAWAYTVDGGEVGEIQYENFNAASVELTFTGINVHPGSAKGKMRNAAKLAILFDSMLPKDDTPEQTENYQGFFHLMDIKGSIEKATMSYIIRDFDISGFQNRLIKMKTIMDTFNDQYPNSVSMKTNQQYFNMSGMMKKNERPVKLAEKAMLREGITPVNNPIRGGTDGAQLSTKELACPNIFTGGLNFHGQYEFIPLPSMEKATKVITAIAELNEPAYIH